jgi:flagellar protein FlbD
MIKLHRLSGTEISLNADLIETIESCPDTIVNFSTGNRLVVKESVEEVTALVVEYKRLVNLARQERNLTDKKK